MSFVLVSRSTFAKRQLFLLYIVWCSSVSSRIFPICWWLYSVRCARVSSRIFPIWWWLYSVRCADVSNRIFPICWSQGKLICHPSSQTEPTASLEFVVQLFSPHGKKVFRKCLARVKPFNMALNPIKRFSWRKNRLGADIEKFTRKTARSVAIK